MRILLSLYAVWAMSLPAHAQMPQYSAESIVCEASGMPGLFAPNSLISIHGRHLAWVERSRTDDDVRDGTLPLILPGTSVVVMVNGLAAPVQIVSPERVTFLMPPGLAEGRAEIRLIHAGRSGPGARVELAAQAPALFLWEPGIALARHAESSEWVEPGRPALPGDEVIVYAAGLGATDPPLEYRRMPEAPAEIAARDSLLLWLNEHALGGEDILYAGVMPGFPGLYEVRFKLPAGIPSNPVLRLQIGERFSQEEIRLAVAGEDIDW